MTGNIYAGDYDHCLYAFDGATGAIRFKTCAANKIEASPSVALIQDHDHGRGRDHGGSSGGNATREIVVVGSWDGRVRTGRRRGALTGEQANCQVGQAATTHHGWAVATKHWH